MAHFQSIRFCEKCDNKYYHQIFYPESEEGVEAEGEPTLQYYCRVCGYIDKNLTQNSLCVLDTQKYKNIDLFNHIYNQYTKYDPTLPHVFVPCPNQECKTNKSNSDDTQSGTTDAIYLRYNAEGMKYLYVCTHCEYKWKNEV